MVCVPGPATDGLNVVPLTPFPLNVPPEGFPTSVILEPDAHTGDCGVMLTPPKVRLSEMGVIKSFNAAVEDEEAFVVIQSVLILRPAQFPVDNDISCVMLMAASTNANGWYVVFPKATNGTSAVT